MVLWLSTRAGNEQDWLATLKLPEWFGDGDLQTGIFKTGLERKKVQMSVSGYH